MNLFILFIIHRIVNIFITMKKLFIAAAAITAAIIPFSACGASVDYTAYISEKRSEIYLYKDDNLSLSVYCVSREQPYNADGICGDMCDLVEISVKLSPTPENVEITLGDIGGEMNYEAVDGKFTFSYTAEPFNAEGVDVALTVNGEQKTYRALNVADSGVMSCEQILGCAAEYDRELFASLTRKRDFEGEIYIRLLYDEGCYYYVGVCDRDKNITAYLLDGGSGKVIATKKTG